MKSEAQQRLGTLFNASDYPSTLDGLFDMEWSVVPIEPPQYLVALNARGVSTGASPGP
jgi:hypothetical protein